MAKENKKAEQPVNEGDSSEIGQLREILFGQTNREFQQQLSQLESKFEQQFNALSRQLEENVNRLTNSLDSHVKALSAQLSEDSHQHQRAEEELKGLHDTLKSELEVAEAAAQDDTTKLESKLSKELDEIETLFNQRHEALLARLQQVTDELSTSKTDRKTLASLLSTMATNLATDQS